jgi:hypothetical protein
MPAIIPAIVSYGVQALTVSTLGAIGSGIAGAIAGGLVAGVLAPTTKTQGPRVGDLQVMGSSYGSVIPYVIGSPRIAGQIVWASTKREIAVVTESGGKGGGGTQSTNYTYEVDLLIVLTENIIVGVRRCWSNGKLIWSAADTASNGTVTASAATTAWTRMTMYTGSAAQLPDPTYEAAVTTANACAYRSRGSVFIQGLQLGSSSQVPNLTWEIATASTITGADTILLIKGSAGLVDSSIYAIPLSVGSGTPAQVSSNQLFGADTIYLGSSDSVSINDIYLANALSNNEFCFEIWCYPTTTNARVFFVGGTMDMLLNNLGLWTANFVIGYASYVMQSLVAATLNVWTHIAVVRENGSGNGYLKLYVNGILRATSANFATSPVTTNPGLAGILGTTSSTLTGYYADIRWTRNARVYTGPFTPPTTRLQPLAPVILYGVTPVTVSAAITALCLRAGMVSAMFDVTALGAMTSMVRAMTVSQVTSTRTLLESIRTCFFVDAVLSDKIYFYPLGGTVVATIPYSDLGADGGQRLALRDSDELETPAQFAMSYANIDNDHQVDTQYSDRLLTGQPSVNLLQVPFDFTSAEAKAIVDANLMSSAIALRHATIAIGRVYFQLEPTDPIIITDVDGSTYRTRVVKKATTGGVIKLDVVVDDATVYTQSGITTPAATGQTTVLPTAATAMQLLDIPLLVETDNSPGLYVAVEGTNTGWKSAVVYDSLDNVNYTTRASYVTQAVIGMATTTLGNWTGGNTLDITNTVTINVGLLGQQLYSSTLTAIYANLSTNLAVIGNELIQFVKATLVSTGVYTLSGLLRGRRGTEWAMSGHSGIENFVQLAASGLRYLPLQSNEIGKLRYYKAISSGLRIANVNAQTITPMGISLKPFAPINFRANRASTDTILIWERRTRFGYRITGSLVWLCPLGETTENYAVDIYSSNTYTTIVRTLVCTTNNVTYTSAQQVTDFGSNQSIIYAKVYQLSGIVGRGYALTASS